MKYIIVVYSYNSESSWLESKLCASMHSIVINSQFEMQASF